MRASFAASCQPGPKRITRFHAPQSGGATGASTKSERARPVTSPSAETMSLHGPAGAISTAPVPVAWSAPPRGSTSSSASGRRAATRTFKPGRQAMRAYDVGTTRLATVRRLKRHQRSLPSHVSAIARGTSSHSPAIVAPESARFTATRDASPSMRETVQSSSFASPIGSRASNTPSRSA